MWLITMFAGILFFINPSFRMMDFLPDVIGCILIILSMSKLSHIEDRLFTARKAIFYFTALSAVKLPLSFIVAIKAKKYLLPCSFLFSVAEIIVMIVFFVSLFGGLEYLVSRDTQNKGHAKKAENASVVCFIFSIARGVASFAPELLVLGEQSDSFDYSYRPTPEQNAALIKPYAELLCFVVILVFGIYTAVLCGKYLIGLFNDKDFISNLHSRIKKHELDNITTYAYRRTKNSFTVLFFALLFLPNIILDGVNVLPNVLPFVFLILGMIILERVSKDRKTFMQLSLFVVLAPLSVYNNIMQYKLLSATDIEIVRTEMTIKNVPVILKNVSNLFSIALPVVLEYILIAVILVTIIRKINSLPYIKSDDTISIFEILLYISGFAFLLSSVGTCIGPFVRTAFSYASGNISEYIRYDSIVEIFEFSSYISFAAMLYFAYKYSRDVLSDFELYDKQI